MIRLIQLFAGVLRYFGLIPAYDYNDILNAEQEDRLRDHNIAVNELLTVTAARVKSNTHLKATLAQARRRTIELVEFEQVLRDRQQRDHHRAGA